MTISNCWKCTLIRLDAIGEFLCRDDHDMNEESCEHYDPEAGTDEGVRDE